MISVKVHRFSFETLIAACDEDLLGKKFSEGKLNLEISREFYESIIVDDVEFLRQLNFATIANLVGENVIKKVIDAGIIDESSIIKIDGIPHAQIAVHG